MKTFRYVLIFSLMLHGWASGQQSLQPLVVWRCELPGGVFAVALSSITSVSNHEYVVDGVARVTEVTVATTGSVVARFYYLEPFKLKSPVGVGQSVLDKVEEKIGEVTQRAEQAGVEPVWKKVVKNYPTTTHAHTVEYRVESKEQLDKIFTSVERSWRSNQPASLKIP